MSQDSIGPVLAIDIGTSSSRSALFDGEAHRIPGSLAQAEYHLETAADGTAELDPKLLLRAVQECLATTVKFARTPIAAVGVSCFWHSLLPVGKFGAPLGPIVTWADSRCREEAAALRKELSEETYHARTGCMLRTSFWPAKLRWIASHRKNLLGRAYRWMSPAEWVQQELCGETRCALGMATGTGLFDPSTRAWCPDLLELTGLRTDQLSELSCAPSRPGKETTRHLPQLAAAEWFPAIGDGAASNLGTGATVPGRGAINVGTSAALRVMQSGDEARAPFGLFCFRVDESRYLVGGAVSNAGNVRAWCLRNLRLPDNPAALEEALAKRPRPEHGIDVLPFFSAERAPFWDDEARSVIAGLTPASQPLDLLQAVIEGSYQRLALISSRIPSRAGEAPPAWIVGGGITKSRSSMQRLANIMAQPLFTTSEPEASLRGAAVYALERLGHEPPLTALAKPFRPDPGIEAAYAAQRDRLARLEALRP